MSDSFFERVQAFTPIICDDNMSSWETDVIIQKLSRCCMGEPGTGSQERGDEDVTNRVFNG